MNYKEYRPGVHKLLRHLGHLDSIVKGVPVAPIHISVWPTNKCQLNCDYCCCRNTMRNDSELDIELYKKALLIFSKYGTKAIEMSGGGEPLLWKHIDEGVDFAHSIGMKQSLITNGLALADTSVDTLRKFEWIRISVQSVIHAKKIDYDSIPVKTSLSYMVSSNICLSDLMDLHEFSKSINIPTRIAVVRPCSKERVSEIENIVDNLGAPVFFSNKKLGKPKGCYMAWIRAAIDWNGNFFPCPSIQLNKENEGFIPDSFILCNIKNIEKWILNNSPHDLGYQCSFCNCGKEENDFIHELLEDTIDADFV